MKTKMKTELKAITILLIFITVGVVLWQTLDKQFYFFNFLYIGVFVSIGAYLKGNNKPYARNVAQIGVGLYMLIYLGGILGENMQITGFWYYLFLGVFEAAVIHYVVAKIVGPLLFGRGWCGYACWTAALLDMLPYKIPKNQRVNKLDFIRYIVFVLSLCFVSVLFLLKFKNMETIMFWSFVIGNILYYIVGVILAFILKDNRAFCKYICPITVFLKPMSYFSITRIKVEKSKCISCGKCKKVCPMNVDMLDIKRSRKNGTECILCLECVHKCPTKAVKL